MPLELSRGDRKLLLVAGGIFVALIIISLVFASPDSSKVALPTTYSSNSYGAKAAYLLLQERGYKVQRWRQSPLQLHADQNTVLILVEPTVFPREDERNAILGFVSAGGRIVISGVLANFLLPHQQLVPVPLATKGWERYKALAPSAVTRAAPSIVLSPQSYWLRPSEGIALYGDETRAMVVRYPYGKGELLWLASAIPLTNAGIKESGNLEFLLAVIGDKSANQILWDEYFHGYRDDSQASGKSFALKWTLAQFAVLCVAILFTFSRRSGPIRAPAVNTRLSPLEFVQTLGGLYERARAAGVVVDIYYQQFLCGASQRLGISTKVSIEELERALRNRCKFDEQGFRAVLQACASARYNTDLSPAEALRLIQALHSYAVRLKLVRSRNKENA